MIKKILSRSPCFFSGEEPGIGCIPANPVVDPLIISADVAVLRGEFILDDQGRNWVVVSISGPNSGNYEPGKIALVTGTAFGSFLCKIVSVQFADDFSAGSSVVQLQIKKIG